MLIFQGRVNVSGSSMVASYRRWFGDVARVALGDLQLVAVEIAGAVEPGLVVEARRHDDKRLALPAADRLAHPRVDGRGTGVLHEDVADGARVLVRDEEWLWLWKIWNG